MHNYIAGELGSGIVSGLFAPGDVLPGEIEFSERLKVSRTVYREAIRMLAAKGLVLSKPKIGTRVTERCRWNLLDVDVLGWLFGLEVPDHDLVRDLFETRRIIETEAAGLAALRFTDADIADMRDALLRMKLHLQKSEQGMLAARDFHRSIFKATGNQVLLSVSDSICAIIDWTTLFKSRAAIPMHDGLQKHQLVYEMIVARDREGAARAMGVLLDLTFDDVSSAILRLRPSV
ncbi:FadR family transcriptional regulator [Paraburkholderia aspalathi]|nr:FadR family transcriptional regulator [Paraburkholderia aspalathi]